MTDTRPSNPVFNAAGGSLGAGGDTAAVIVDVQLGCVKYMSREDCRNYLSALGETIEDMRTRGIPVNWVVMGRNDGLVRPETGEGAEQTRPREELARMGFMNPDPFNVGDMAKDNGDIFEEFINTHGPRRNEAVSIKDNYFNAFKSDEFTAHLQGRGVKNIVTAGLVGSVCALETAIGGVQRGFNTGLLLDNIACWGRPRERADEIAPLVWREGYSSPDAAHRWHRNEIAAALVKQSREFTDADRQAAARINYTTYSDFTSSAPASSPPPHSPPAPRAL